MAAKTGEPPHAAALAPVGRVPLLAVAVLLVAAAAWFMAVPDANVAAFVAVQAVTQRLPDEFWAMVTICGTGVVAFALLSTTLPWQPRWYAAALPAAAFAGLYSNGLKNLYRLPRPASVLDGGHVHVIGHVLHANTFPSGHSVTAFTLAALLVFGARRPAVTALWALPLACVVALSRIAVGAHWPADLAAGAVGGWLSGAFAMTLAAHWRGWNEERGVRLLALVAVGIGLSLFVVDLGYPMARGLQDASGIVAIVMGAIALARPRRDPLLPVAGRR